MRINVNWYFNARRVSATTQTLIYCFNNNEVLILNQVALNGGVDQLLIRFFFFFANLFANLNGNNSIIVFKSGLNSIKFITLNLNLFCNRDIIRKFYNQLLIESTLQPLNILHSTTIVKIAHNVNEFSNGEVNTIKLAPYVYNTLIQAKAFLYYH